LAYFQSLCRAAQTTRVLSAGKAMTAQGDVAAFVVVGHGRGTSYYLHGGYQDRHSALRPGYFAMRWALETSRDRGSERFNFLVSPTDQPALRSYKESFGGLSSERWHWQQPLTVAGRAAMFALVVADRTRDLFGRGR
jgi:CelD/BcsL family acetyltransferase involved in cellulose biosynthesis